MNELINIDPNFNKEMFITKINNIFVLLHTAVMMNDLNRVKHFLSPSLVDKYEGIIQSLNNRNVIQMYDELNVKDTNIEEITIDQGKVTIKVTIVSRYMDYLVDKDTKKYVSGNNQYRVEKNNSMEFTKDIGASYKSVVAKCPTCGNSISVNNYGECEFCRTIFNAKDFDWILTSITTI